MCVRACVCVYIYLFIYLFIHSLTAIGLSPGSSTHLHTNNTQNNTINNRKTQTTTNVEECGPCPVFASFTLAFALQLRKKHGKTSVRLRKTSEYSTHITKTPTHYKTLTKTHSTKPTQKYTVQNPHIHTHTHIHALQNNIKPPQYKLKQNATN